MVNSITLSFPRTSIIDVIIFKTDAIQIVQILNRKWKTTSNKECFITLQIYITIQFFSGVSRILLVNIYSENTGQSASKTLFSLREFENERKYYTGNGKSSHYYNTSIFIAFNF